MEDWQMPDALKTGFEFSHPPASNCICNSFFRRHIYYTVYKCDKWAFSVLCAAFFLL